ncbi:hypothetical protein A2X44_03225 [candidate division CPR3 bacterium GWF2_35_18]|uniref:MutT/NUDIX family protein n=1 Tax=candidate division CPR3 bacterium GW2011_GWF2_35_18 TaxID=1618350 RepID=A0A0G0EQD3_UNCC3|nr:MAG: MutT/NUDIX family protein [candidate division CPR3 bacterium GW2011_GWF2_35_18]KKR24141.1 MAG: nudix hydrolase, 7,8-dihydro-8-oxoguanine triphosphatase [Candidatus Peregrinibacteria bacterium GW2011_GWE2_39_6]OGB62996.1 MAG: hypothetical protein A2X44_03225 [candidate division CPR3 bacterium GWF2_35_18]OGB63980.1 MAG: hypothetical protein A2250_02980 [candidate division CPR3 bacterium RIFOXYA2_FULL_35_13]OGB76328.1 MAG: hypothetical protein A2476_00715 [candidate division CPR3 bacterium
MNNKVICVDLQGKKYEIEVNKLTFRPSVYAVIIKNGQVLLSKQWDGYDFPGGAIELGETIEAALIREVFEETGYNVKVGKFISCHTSFFKLPDSEKFVHSILFYYTAEVTGGKLTTKNFVENEIGVLSLAEWIDLEKVEDIRYYNTINSVEIIKKSYKL